MCSKDIPAPCPLLAALRWTFLSCSSHIPESWGVTIWGRATLAVSGQSSNTFHFLGMISMIWGLGFFLWGGATSEGRIQCQLREYTCSLNIGILPQWSLVSHKLGHGFMSFMASEWIWVIFRFWVQQLKKSFPGCVWPTESMWCCFFHCDQSLVPSKEDVIIFFCLKTSSSYFCPLHSWWLSLCPCGPYWRHLTVPQTTQNFQQQMHFT